MIQIVIGFLNFSILIQIPVSIRSLCQTIYTVILINCTLRSYLYRIINRFPMGIIYFKIISSRYGWCKWQFVNIFCYIIGFISSPQYIAVWIKDMKKYGCSLHTWIISNSHCYWYTLPHIKCKAVRISASSCKVSSIYPVCAYMRCRIQCFIAFFFIIGGNPGYLKGWCQHYCCRIP